MAIQKTWSVTKVVVIKNLFQYENVINSVDWKFTVQNDGENGSPPQIVHFNGTVNLALPDGTTSFVEYSNVTNAMLIEFIKGALGAKAQEIELDAERHFVGILAQNNPTFIVLEEAALPA